MEADKSVKIKILTTISSFYLAKAIRETDEKIREEVFREVRSYFNKSDKIEINEKTSFVLKGFYFFYQNEIKQSSDYFNIAKDSDPAYVPCILGRVAAPNAGHQRVRQEELPGGRQPVQGGPSTEPQRPGANAARTRAVLLLFGGSGAGEAHFPVRAQEGSPRCSPRGLSAWRPIWAWQSSPGARETTRSSTSDSLRCSVSSPTTTCSMSTSPNTTSTSASSHGYALPHTGQEAYRCGDPQYRPAGAYFEAGEEEPSD
jgi:hypothetical protein